MNNYVTPTPPPVAHPTQYSPAHPPGHAAPTVAHMAYNPTTKPPIAAHHPDIPYKPPSPYQSTEKTHPLQDNRITKEYHAPITKYHPPEKNYTPVVEEYHPPVEEYHPPVKEFHPPVEEYHPSDEVYHPPVKEYHPSVKDYHPQVKEYHTPVKEYNPSVNDYHPQAEEYDHTLKTLYNPPPVPTPIAITPVPHNYVTPNNFVKQGKPSTTVIPKPYDVPTNHMMPPKKEYLSPNEHIHALKSTYKNTLSSQSPKSYEKPAVDMRPPHSNYVPPNPETKHHFSTSSPELNYKTKTEKAHHQPKVLRIENNHPVLAIQQYQTIHQLPTTPKPAIPTTSASYVKQTTPHHHYSYNYPHAGQLYQPPGLLGHQAPLAPIDPHLQNLKPSAPNDPHSIGVEALHGQHQNTPIDPHLLSHPKNLEHFFAIQHQSLQTTPAPITPGPFVTPQTTLHNSPSVISHVNPSLRPALNVGGVDPKVVPTVATLPPFTPPTRPPNIHLTPFTQQAPHTESVHLQPEGRIEPLQSIVHRIPPTKVINVAQETPATDHQLHSMMAFVTTEQTTPVSAEFSFTPTPSPSPPAHVHEPHPLHPADSSQSQFPKPGNNLDTNVEIRNHGTASLQPQPVFNFDRESFQFTPDQNLIVERPLFDPSTIDLNKEDPHANHPVFQAVPDDNFRDQPNPPHPQSTRSLGGGLHHRFSVLGSDKAPMMAALPGTTIQCNPPDSSGSYTCDSFLNNNHEVTAKVTFPHTSGNEYLRHKRKPVLTQTKRNDDIDVIEESTGFVEKDASIDFDTVLNAKSTQLLKTIFQKNKENHQRSFITTTEIPMTSVDLTPDSNQQIVFNASFEKLTITKPMQDNNLKSSLKNDFFKTPEILPHFVKSSNLSITDPPLVPALAGTTVECHLPDGNGSYSCVSFQNKMQVQAPRKHSLQFPKSDNQFMTKKQNIGLPKMVKNQAKIFKEKPNHLNLSESETMQGASITLKLNPKEMENIQKKQTLEVGEKYTEEKSFTRIHNSGQENQVVHSKEPKSMFLNHKSAEKVYKQTPDISRLTKHVSASRKLNSSLVTDLQSPVPEVKLVKVKNSKGYENIGPNQIMIDNNSFVTTDDDHTNPETVKISPAPSVGQNIVNNEEGNVQNNVDEHLSTQTIDKDLEQTFEQSSKTTSPEDINSEDDVNNTLIPKLNSVEPIQKLRKERKEENMKKINKIIDEAVKRSIKYNKIPDSSRVSPTTSAPIAKVTNTTNYDPIFNPITGKPVGLVDRNTGVFYPVGHTIFNENYKYIRDKMETKEEDVNSKTLPQLESSAKEDKKKNELLTEDEAVHSISEKFAVEEMIPQIDPSLDSLTEEFFHLFHGDKTLSK